MKDAEKTWWRGASAACMIHLAVAPTPPRAEDGPPGAPGAS